MDVNDIKFSTNGETVYFNTPADILMMENTKPAAYTSSEPVRVITAGNIRGNQHTFTRDGK